MSREESFTTPTKGYPELPAVTPESVLTREPTTPGAPLIERIRRSPPRTRGGENRPEDTTLHTADNKDDRGQADALALMMFSPRGTSELPELRTEAWPHEGQKPNPISISKARKLLAAAYASVPCEIEAAGVHGHAWIIETQDQWVSRSGTTPITVPTKPLKDTTYEIRKQMEYADKMETYRMYNHLVQEGKTKLIAWFGKPMFVDLFKDGLLPNTLTPKELLAHLETTYSQGRDYRRHMEQVERAFNKAYDPAQPVEGYFMQLQDARDDAALLGQPYTDQQAMNKALKQFEKHYEKEAYKAEKKWNEANDPTDWAAFKTFWKSEIHQWETIGKSIRRANQAVMDKVDMELSSMRTEVAALQAENREYQERSNAYAAEHIQFKHALQAENNHRNSSDDSTISTITTYVDHKINALSQQMAGLTASTANQTAGQRNTAQLLETARHRAPDFYRTMNNGRGKPFSKYCWKCGVNTTHGTRRCYELTPEQKAKYGEASPDNTMGGSTKFLERRGHYQCEYAFDSL